MQGQIADDESVLAVSVLGSAASGHGPRAGILVTVQTLDGEVVGQAKTQPAGCATFTLPIEKDTQPTYRVWLDGKGDKSHSYVSADGQTRPSREVTIAGPRQLTRVKFENFDKAATLKVNVVASGVTEVVQSVRVEPVSSLGQPFWANLTGASAQIANLYPGTYTLSAGNAEPVAVTLAEGETRSVTLLIPGDPADPTDPGQGDQGGDDPTGPASDCDGSQPPETLPDHPINPVDPCAGATPPATPATPDQPEDQ
jgi:hypothetical protein